MDILFSSVLCSYNTLELLKNNTGKDVSGQTMQKFFRLIAMGLSEQANVTCITALPVVGTKKTVLNFSGDKEKRLSFIYPCIIDFPILRQISIFFGTLFYGLRWLRKTKRQERFVFCDVLNITLCSALLFLRIWGVHVMGIMTDMPALMVCRNSSLRHKLFNSVNMFLLTKMDSYVFLTETMNTAINKKHKPYIVMEGIADEKMRNRERHRNVNTKEILYAGGLFEQYGVLALIEAFREVQGDDLKLILYGSGPMISDMTKYIALDPRLEYRGLKPNCEIVEAELTATLLVNPRPTSEEFVKYSFPSKNMEYMASGTPLLTTNLPGMPKEYHKYVYLFDKEDPHSMSKVLNKILNEIPLEELDNFGEKAKQFVMENKNNIYQAKRIVDMFIL